MRVGSFVPQRTLDRSFVDVGRECEDLGFASVAVLDHLMPLGAPDGTPLLDSFVTLSAVAAVTTRVRLVTVVVRAGMRPPAMTVHLARSVAAVAPGRLVLGLGSGDRNSAREDALLGLPDRAMATRREELVAALHAVRAALPDLPVWVGGRSDATATIAGQHADALNVWAATVGEARHAHAVAADAADAAGRSRPGWTWAGQVVVAPTDDEAIERAGALRTPDRVRALVGAPETVAERLRVLADAGADEALVAFVGGAAAAQRRLFARAVLPLL